jgi:hypothetical protein
MAWGRGPSSPAEIPTIKAESGYKQKPVDPGGIDIPHQDVRVYDELESKTTPQIPVEHLLPPAETPQEAPHALSPPAAVVAVMPSPLPQVVKGPNNDTVLSETRLVKTIDTTVTPSVVPTPAPVPMPPTASVPPALVQPGATPQGVPKVEPLSIDQVIANTKVSSTVAATSKGAAPTGSVAIQLASATDEAKAQGMMKDLQQKYASQLGGAVLHLSRADLGSRGVYYRIQSQSLAENDANQICSALKQINAGCILVRK